MRNVSDKSCREIKTHVLCSRAVFLKKSCVHEIIWKNTAESGRPQMTTWCMRVACRIPKATNKHSKYVIIIAFPLHLWLHDHASLYCTLPVLTWRLEFITNLMHNFIYSVITLHHDPQHVSSIAVLIFRRTIVYLQNLVSSHSLWQHTEWDDTRYCRSEERRVGKEC
jgi:hypothetical protein